MNSNIVNLLRFLILQSEEGKKTPIEILHKYLIRNEEYEEFFNIVNKALPSDLFGDDDWIKELIGKIKDKNDRAKFEELCSSFDDLRTFMRNNKMFNKLVCGFPDPEMDAKIIERMCCEHKDNLPKR